MLKDWGSSYMLQVKTEVPHQLVIHRQHGNKGAEFLIIDYITACYWLLTCPLYGFHFYHRKTYLDKQCGGYRFMLLCSYFQIVSYKWKDLRMRNKWWALQTTLSCARLAVAIGVNHYSVLLFTTALALMMFQSWLICLWLVCQSSVNHFDLYERYKLRLD